jgi:hypothetical protein
MNNVLTVQFVTRADGPEKLVCEAEVHFGADAGPLAGMKLVGLSVWSGPDGDHYLTLPSRAFGAGMERKYFDYLRSADGTMAAPRTFKDWVLSEYKRQEYKRQVSEAARDLKRA